MGESAGLETRATADLEIGATGQRYCRSGEARRQRTNLGHTFGEWFRVLARTCLALGTRAAHRLLNADGRGIGFRGHLRIRLGRGEARETSCLDSCRGLGAVDAVPQGCASVGLSGAGERYPAIQRASARRQLQTWRSLTSFDACNFARYQLRVQPPEYAADHRPVVLCPHESSAAGCDFVPLRSSRSQ